MVRSVATHLADVIACIRAADGGGLLSVADLPPSGGLAGLKTVAVLQRLLGRFAGDDETCYLEVGVYRGLTLLSAMVPPASDDRTLFVNEWLVYRHGMVELAPEALDLARVVCAGDAETAVCGPEYLQRSAPRIPLQCPETGH